MGRLYKHPLVEEDLAQIYAYIVRKSGHRKIALQVYDTIEQAFFQILENPLLGSLFPNNIPSLQGLQRFLAQSYKLRYHIFFLRSSEEVRVLYVFHHAQDIPSRLEKDIRE